MNIAVRRESDISVFSVSGRMDAMSAPNFEEQLDRWLEKNETVLLIDFEALDYISSAGLRVLLSAAKKMKAKQGKLILARLQDSVKQVFDVSGFATIIPIHDTVEAALDTLK
jgi:anti-anti-sigma factor